MSVLGIAALLNPHRAGLGLLALVLLGAALAVMPDPFWRRFAAVLEFQRDDSIMGRLYAWKIGVLIALDRPFIGVGIGCFALAWPIYAGPEAGNAWKTAHNAFIQVLGEAGVVALVAFVSVIIAVMARLWRGMRPRSGEPAALAKGVFIALWGYVTCAMALSIAFNWFLYLLLALGIAVARFSAANDEKTDADRFEIRPHPPLPREVQA
jgi:O-antigen ligase